MPDWRERMTRDLPTDETPDAKGCGYGPIFTEEEWAEQAAETPFCAMLSSFSILDEVGDEVASWEKDDGGNSGATFVRILTQLDRQSPGKLRIFGYNIRDIFQVALADASTWWARRPQRLMLPWWIARPAAAPFIMDPYRILVPGEWNRCAVPMATVCRLLGLPELTDTMSAKERAKHARRMAEIANLVDVVAGNNGQIGEMSPVLVA